MVQNLRIPKFQAHIFFLTGVIIEFLCRSRKIRNLSNSRLLIEAGEKGWESFFFTELRFYAEETLGTNQILTLSTSRSWSYFEQLKRKIVECQPSHMIIDPRSGSQKNFLNLFDAFRLKIVLSRKHVVPILILPDASIRIHRLQSILLCGRKGVITTFASYEFMKKLFSGVKCVGPIPIPISSKRLAKVNKTFVPYGPKSTIQFIGSNYPERQNFFNEVEFRLRNSNSDLNLKITNKSLGMNNDDYWNSLIASSVVITTTFQTNLDNKKLDLSQVNQMVFRISEALASFNLLFCMSVPGMHEFFVADRDFVEFTSPGDLASKLMFYAKNPESQKRIALSGYETYNKFQKSLLFWDYINRKTNSSLVTNNFNIW
jgi:hypothetical protein